MSLLGWRRWAWRADPILEHGEGLWAGLRGVAGGCWHLVPPGGIGLTCQLKFQLLWASLPALFSCLVLVFSRLLPVVLQGLLSCCVCVYINVSSLLVWTNKNLWSSAKRQVMSQLEPKLAESSQGREVSQGSNLTGSTMGPIKQNVVVGFMGHQGELQSKTCTSSWDMWEKGPLPCSHPKCCCNAGIKWTKLNNLYAPVRFSISEHWGLK